MKGSKGSILRPLLMVGFVMVMVFLMQENIEEKQELQEQQTVIDPASVIYSDIGVIEGTLPEEEPADVEQTEAQTEKITENTKEGEGVSEESNMEK